MASSRAADEFIRMLHCPNCDCAFDLDGNKPRFLRCYHSVCESCLDFTLKRVSEVFCKECNVLTQAASPKIDGFPVNHYLVSIIPLFDDDDDGKVRLNRPYVNEILESFANQDDPTANGGADSSSAASGHASSSSKNAVNGAGAGWNNPVPSVSDINSSSSSRVRSSDDIVDQPPRRRQKSSDRRQASSRHGNLDPTINPSLSRFGQVTKLEKREADETCTICADKLNQPSGYDDPGVSGFSVVRLLCGHVFHHNCVVQMVKNNEVFLKCPSCNTVHGTRVGNQPVGGTMDIRYKKASGGYFGSFSFSSQYLSGFEKDSLGIFEITYDFPSGIQGPEHPNPGQPYYPVGFPRSAYLPANERGLEVLCMLKVAFERRLTFTVGISATTNMPDSVIWTGIHHKTKPYGGSYGYPDPNYLDNVTQELAAVGITPADIPGDIPGRERLLGITLS